MSTAGMDNRNAARIVREIKTQARAQHAPYGHRVGSFAEPFRCVNHAECGAEHMARHLARNHERACRRKSPAERAAWAKSGTWPWPEKPDTRVTCPTCGRSRVLSVRRRTQPIGRFCSVGCVPFRGGR